MTGCNRTVVFEYEKFCGKSFDDMPKGEFLRLSVNPYNGKVVMQVNDAPAYGLVISEIVWQLERDMRMLSLVSGGKAGIREFADMCEREEREEMRPHVVRMVRDGTVGPMMGMKAC